MSRHPKARLELLEEFRKAGESEPFGVYLVRRWADAQLVAVLPLWEHPPFPDVPLPASTISRVINPLAAFEPEHPSVHSLLHVPYPLLLRVGSGCYWDTRAVLPLWSELISKQHKWAVAVKHGARSRHMEDYRQWLALTSALANDFGDVELSGEFREAMLRAADAVRHSVEWATRYLEDPPEDALRRSDLILTIHLWAVDQFVDAVNHFLELAAWVPWSSEPPAAPTLIRRSELIRVMMGPRSWSSELDRIADPVEQADAWKMRIKRMADRVRQDLHADLMSDVLRSVMRSEPSMKT